jgi:hypothetical protein
MGKSTGINGEFRVLEEFVCEAVLHDLPENTEFGRGENAGFVLAMPSDSTCIRSRDELQLLSTPELCLLVQLAGSDLPRETLQLIHDIAIERLSSDPPSPDQRAGTLSKIVMEQAVARIAASAT